MAEPSDRIDLAEAARILSCPPDQVRDVLDAHGQSGVAPLSRRDVEVVALTRWRRSHASGPDSYWVTREQACEILGVNRARVGQLVAAGLVPFERARTPRQQIVFRRAQLEVVAHARAFRWRRWREGAPAGPLTRPE